MVLLRRRLPTGFMDSFFSRRHCVPGVIDVLHIRAAERDGDQRTAPGWTRCMPSRVADRRTPETGGKVGSRSARGVRGQLLHAMLRRRLHIVGPVCRCSIREVVTLRDILRITAHGSTQILQATLRLSSRQNPIARRPDWILDNSLRT